MTKNSAKQRVSGLLSDIEGGSNDQRANELLVRCYNALIALSDQLDALSVSVQPEIKQEANPGKWTLSRLWRSWMSSTAEWMAGNGAVMPLVLRPDGTYKKTRPFNKDDAHELFTRTWLGEDSDGNRFSWAKKASQGEVIADKSQRFHAMQQHQIWMTERGISHINPRESDYADLLKKMDGLN